LQFAGSDEVARAGRGGEKAWTMFTPAMKLKSSPAMCGALPAPADAMLTFPGLAFA
jgi:hypothetical protein